jgi:hypothetical protein
MGFEGYMAAYGESMQTEDVVSLIGLALEAGASKVEYGEALQATAHEYNDRLQIWKKAGFASTKELYAQLGFDYEKVLTAVVNHRDTVQRKNRARIVIAGAWGESVANHLLPNTGESKIERLAQIARITMDNFATAADAINSAYLERLRKSTRKPVLSITIGDIKAALQRVKSKQAALVPTTSEIKKYDLCYSHRLLAHRPSTDATEIDTLPVLPNRTAGGLLVEGEKVDKEDNSNSRKKAASGKGKGVAGRVGNGERGGNADEEEESTSKDRGGVEPSEATEPIRTEPRKSRDREPPIIIELSDSEDETYEPPEEPSTREASVTLPTKGKGSRSECGCPIGVPLARSIRYAGKGGAKELKEKARIAMLENLYPAVTKAGGWEACCRLCLQNICSALGMRSREPRLTGSVLAERVEHVYKNRHHLPTLKAVKKYWSWF